MWVHVSLWDGSALANANTRQSSRTNCMENYDFSFSLELKGAELTNDPCYQKKFSRRLLICQSTKQVSYAVMNSNKCWWEEPTRQYILGWEKKIVVSKLSRRIRSWHVYRLQQNPGVNMTRWTERHWEWWAAHRCRRALCPKANGALMLMRQDRGVWNS